MMTEKELKKEAGEWLKDNIRVEIRDGQSFNIVPTPVQIYCAGAEPREKQIAELADRVSMYDFFYEGNGFKRRGLNTAIQIGEYIDKLETQINKMKRCKICKHKDELSLSDWSPCKQCNKQSNWELADN